MSEFDRYQDGDIYQIKIKGNLDTQWSNWFFGMKVSSLEGEQLTTLTGRIADQARLWGILNKIWDLNLMVISVNRTSK